MDGFSKNVVHSVVKLVEVGSHLTSMNWKLEAARAGEARAIANTETKIAELKKSFEATIKNLKTKANSQIQ